MAKSERKSYKNTKLEQNELKPTAIGKFESRNSSSIGIFIILTIFILTISFLPDISEYVEEYLHPSNTPTNYPSNPSTPTDPTEPDDDNDIYETYIENLKVENSDIKISNILVDSNDFKISYDITNKSNQSQNLEDLNYYIEIYNTEGTFIERVKIADADTLKSQAFLHYDRNISSEAASTVGYIGVVKKTEEEYPLIELNESGILVCNKEHEKVTYKFQNEKLKEVVSEVSYLSTDEDYYNILEDSKIKQASYNNLSGITSTIFEYVGVYNITTNVNLEEAKRTNIFSADTFSLDTEPKVVSFEMEAQGFKCE